MRPRKTCKANRCRAHLTNRYERYMVNDMSSLRKLIAVCCIGIVAACGGEIQKGDKGDSVVGANGAPGADAPPATNGVDGKPGADSNVAGPAGTNGTDGASVKGDRGEVGQSGSDGDAGHIGDIACGDSLITSEEWHSACNVDAGNTSSGALVCTVGQVQCRLYLTDPDNESSEVMPRKVCYDVVNHHVSVAPGDNQPGTTCLTDLDCNGSEDDTTTAGDNVALVRHALQYECPVSASDASCDRTFLRGLCRNATKHCLSTDTWCSTQTEGGKVVVSCNGNGSPVEGRVSGNREGVVLSDFGDLNTPTADEAKMGYECTASDSSVLTWDCTMDATTGVASVTCSGPRGL